MTPRNAKRSPESLTNPDEPSERPDWSALSRAGKKAIAEATAMDLPEEEALWNAAALHKSNPFIWHAAVMAYIRINRHSDAHRVIDQALDSVPKGTRAALYRDRAELLSGASAIQAFKDGIEDDPMHAPLYIGYGNELSNMGRMDQARVVFKAGIAAVRPGTARAQVYKTWAVNEYLDGQHEASRDLWKEVTKETPHDARAWRRLADSEERLGADLSVVHDIFSKGLCLHPTNSELRVGLARIDEEINGPGSSRKVLENPATEHDHNALRALANLECKEGNIERARLTYRKAAILESGPLSDELEALDWGSPLEDPNEVPAARNKIRRQLDTAKSLHAWALMESRLGNQTQAKRLLEEALIVADKDSAIWRALGEIESRLKNYASARVAFERSVDLVGQDPRLLLAWGRTETLAGNLERAESLFTQALGVFRRMRPRKGGRSAGLELVEHHPKGSKPKCADRAYVRGLSETLRELAGVYTRRGDRDSAINTLHEATSRDASSESAWRQLAELIRQRDGIEGVRELYRDALTKSRRGLRSKLSHWWALEEKNTGRCAEARQLFETAVAHEPGYMSAWLSWALMEKAEGRIAEASEVFRRATAYAIKASIRAPYIFQAWARLEETYRGNVTKAREIHMRGHNLVPSSGLLLQSWAALEERNGAIDEARKLYRKATKAEPHMGHIWQSWATMESRRRRYREARLLYREGYKRDPSNSALLASWGLLEGREMGSPEMGRALFEKAIAADKNHAHAWHAWGSMELSLGNVAKARDFYLRAASLDPSDPVSWHALGTLEVDHGTGSDPGIYFQRAIDADPAHEISYQAWALAVEKLDFNIEEARRLFALGVERCTPHGKAIVLQGWAMMEQRQGNIPRARELLHQGLSINRRKAELWISLALLEKACGNRKVVMRLFSDSISAVAPAHSVASVYSVWGATEAEYGNVEAARELFRRGIRINPSHEACWRSFANVEEKCGNYELASELRKASTGDLVSSPSKLSDEVLSMIQWREAAPAPAPAPGNDSET